MRKSGLIVLPFALLLSLTACHRSSDGPATIETGDGTVSIPDTPALPYNYDAAKGKPEQLDDTTYLVANAHEFYEALGSNRTIYIDADTLNLTEINNEFMGGDDEIGQHPYFFGLDITGLENLRIIGKGDKPVKMYEMYKEHVVLTFSNCHNLTLTNLDLGHFAQDDFMCEKEVIHFGDCSDITIDKCLFFGTGFEGLTAFDCENIRVTNSEIFDCSGGVFTLLRTNNVSFENCAFYDIYVYYSGVDLGECSNITIDNCSFKHIYADDARMFTVGNCDNCLVNESSFDSCRAKIFVDNPLDLPMASCVIANSEFEE